jgi:hypothetical protein
MAKLIKIPRLYGGGDSGWDYTALNGTATK